MYPSQMLRHSGAPQKEVFHKMRMNKPIYLDFDGALGDAPVEAVHWKCHRSLDAKFRK